MRSASTSRRARKTSLCVAFAACGLFAGSAAHIAHAEDRGGVYGRLDHDTTWSLDVTAGLGVAFDGAHGAFAATGRFRALDMAGLFVGYQNLPGPSRQDALLLGVELRPTMFLRIFLNEESGRRLGDLVFDSLGIELGAGLMRPGMPWQMGSGLGFLLGTGIEVPFTWNAGNAWFVRTGVRWMHAAGWDNNAPGSTPGDDAFLWTVGIGARVMSRVGWIPRK